MNNNGEKKYNIIVKVFFWAVIIRNVTNMITQGIKIDTYETMKMDTTLLWGNMFFSAIIILILYNILQYKKVALDAFYIIQFVNATWLGFQDDEFLTHYIIALILCLIMYGILHIKEGGIAAIDMLKESKDEEEGKSDKKVVYEYEKKDDTIDETKDGAGVMIYDEVQFYEEAHEKEMQKMMEEDNDEYKEELKRKEEQKRKEDEHNMLIRSIARHSMSKFFEFLEGLPKKGDGKVDYNKLTVRQRYIYTKYSVSKEAAIEDLKQDMDILEKEIFALDDELKNSVGGRRLEIRDIMKDKRGEFNEMVDIYSNDIVL